MFREGLQGEIQQSFNVFIAAQYFILLKHHLRKETIQQLKSPPGWILKSTVLKMGFHTCKLPPASAGIAPSVHPRALATHTSASACGPVGARR